MQRLLCLILLFIYTRGSIIKDSPTSIINGEIVNIEDYPYFAHLTYIDGGALLCGGAIIKEDVILTAAHCLEKINFHVYVGISTIVQTIIMEPYSVKKIEPYHKYERNRLPIYDMGLVRLMKKITLGPTVDIIGVSPTYPPMGAQVGVLGFGKETCNYYDTECHGRVSIFLKFAIIEVVDVKDDGAIYTLGKNKNTCSGDSGGPVVYDNKVVGVVSSGQFANCSGYDTQTPTAIYYSWIMKFMKI